MSLDVPVPDPPALESTDPAEYEDATVVADTDYRREELSTYLEDGAWAAAFRRWAAETDLEERQFGVVTDLELLGQYDFFWDDFAGRVGYHAPGIPEDWQERDYHPGLDSWATVSGINAALTELGQTVCDVLAEEYVEWEADFEAPDELPDFE